MNPLVSGVVGPVQSGEEQEDPALVGAEVVMEEQEFIPIRQHLQCPAGAKRQVLCHHGSGQWFGVLGDLRLPCLDEGSPAEGDGTLDSRDGGLPGERGIMALHDIGHQPLEGFRDEVTQIDLDAMEVVFFFPRFDLIIERRRLPPCPVESLDRKLSLSLRRRPGPEDPQLDIREPIGASPRDRSDYGYCLHVGVRGVDGRDLLRQSKSPFTGFVHRLTTSPAG